jgi:hypothetical protein
MGAPRDQGDAMTAIARRQHNRKSKDTPTIYSHPSTRAMSSEEEEFMGEESEEEFQADEESEEEEFLEADEEESGVDDKPLANLKKATPDDDDDDDSDDDSDDDVPLAALKSPAKKKPAPKKAKAEPKKKQATKPKADKPVKKKKKETTAAPSNGSYRSASAALYGIDCMKGKLIQQLLCRWWYVITWPDNVPDEPPKHHDSLDGMPGVFVCTSGSEVGRITDIRDKSKCPNFQNFAQKPSSELKDLLIRALKTQKEALIAVEGSGTDVEKEINTLLKWTEKVNPDKADKEAIKVLKGAKVSLSA